MDKAAQAYCQTQARIWIKASQKGKTTISYTTHRRRCMLEARAWLKASKQYRLGHPVAPWRG